MIRSQYVSHPQSLTFNKLDNQPGSQLVCHPTLQPVTEPASHLTYHIVTQHYQKIRQLAGYSTSQLVRKCRFTSRLTNQTHTIQPAIYHHPVRKPSNTDHRLLSRCVSV